MRPAPAFRNRRRRLNSRLVGASHPVYCDVQSERPVAPVDLLGQMGGEAGVPAAAWWFAKRDKAQNCWKSMPRGCLTSTAGHHHACGRERASASTVKPGLVAPDISNQDVGTARGSFRLKRSPRPLSPQNELSDLQRQGEGFQASSPSLIKNCPRQVSPHAMIAHPHPLADVRCGVLDHKRRFAVVVQHSALCFSPRPIPLHRGPPRAPFDGPPPNPTGCLDVVHAILYGRRAPGFSELLI